MKPKSSPIWNYFDEIDASSAKCKLCEKVYSRKGRTTTALKSHLQAIHAEWFAEFEKLNDAAKLSSETKKQMESEPEPPPPPPKRIRLPAIKVLPQKFLKKPEDDHKPSNEDELDCFCKMAAQTLRKLKEPTQSIALKLMSDVLYHAKMGNLSEASAITTEAFAVYTTKEAS